MQCNQNGFQVLPYFGKQRKSHEQDYWFLSTISSWLQQTVQKNHDEAKNDMLHLHSPTAGNANSFLKSNSFLGRRMVFIFHVCALHWQQYSMQCERFQTIRAATAEELQRFWRHLSHRSCMVFMMICLISGMDMGVFHVRYHSPRSCLPARNAVGEAQIQNAVDSQWPRVLTRGHAKSTAVSNRTDMVQRPVWSPPQPCVVGMWELLVRRSRSQMQVGLSGKHITLFSCGIQVD